MTMDITDVREGRFEAVFPDAESAGDFYERLMRNPAGDHALNVKRNCANGRTVTWTTEVLPVTDPLRMRPVIEYWLSMCETVGYYGSTFGEPPFGTGKKTAYLNGRPCPASM